LNVTEKPNYMLQRNDETLAAASVPELIPFHLEDCSSEQQATGSEMWSTPAVSEGPGYVLSSPDCE